MPLLQLFDKQVTLRMGQANVRRWVTTSCPWSATTPIRSVSWGTPLTVCRLADASRAYEIFQKKEDGAFKVLLQP
jgi:threonine dehydrogenase-like Zn-dependent dehydrogenase